VIEWVRHHRAHHRYVDTDKDPKNAKRGFFYSHMGWLITYTPQEWGPVDITDVKHDKVAQWQQRYYIPLVLAWGFLLPATLAHLITEDFSGGFLYCGCWRTLIGLHTTFLVNSVAHRTGDQPYTTNITARDNYWLGLFTGGESYHNFHHRFPSDYRNGVRRSALDITKWFLWLCEKLGLAKDLIRASDKEIERALNRDQADTSVDQSDWNHCNIVMSWSDYEERARTGGCLVCISGRVCDITDFMYSHPGGQNTLQQAIGTDGTALFNSIDHSPYANRLLYSMQIAAIDANSMEGSLSLKNK
jgi:stearoyl-CoA desaturase (delta-9 desaturase)